MKNQHIRAIPVRSTLQYESATIHRGLPREFPRPGEGFGVVHTAGWLTVTGLFWLKEGPNRVDSAPGTFELRGAKTVYKADDGRVVEMKPDSKIVAGAKTFTVIERSGRYAVRLCPMGHATTAADVDGLLDFFASPTTRRRRPGAAPRPAPPTSASPAR